MGKRTSGMDITGIILLDKRTGVSSNQALQEVRRLLNANKAGHTGSLDPLATGLLPLCFGEATKVSSFMLDDDKCYQVKIQLGVITDTGDLEGTVLEQRPTPEYSASEISACLQQFTGSIAQVPPMYSALKFHGKKLYELARAGITVEREPRKVEIYRLHLLAYQEQCLYLEVFCSKGTYIRSLAEDIGFYLGCGASVAELRRTKAGSYTIAGAWQIEQLRALSATELRQCLLPADAPLAAMPALNLTAQQAVSVNYGQRILISGLDAGMVRLYNDDIFLGLGEVLPNGQLAPKRLFNHG